MKPLKEFEIKRETKAGVEIVRLIGPLDDYSLNLLETALQLLRQAGHQRVIVDCENLDYMSTAGIRALVDFARSAREAKGELVLIKVPDKMQSITKVMGYSSEFQVLGDEATALGKLSTGADKETDKEGAP